MTVTDPIADLLTRIRNASRAHKLTVHVPFSKLKLAICGVLKAHGFLVDVRTAGEGIAKMIVLELDANRSDIHIKSMSRPGQRIYLKSHEIPRILEGLGIAVLSTSKGVMSGSEARKNKLGGEYLCEVY